MPKDTSTSNEKPHGARSRPAADSPKRPLSAYIFFSQEWRERIKVENPDAGFGEIGKLLGARWKTLTETEKKPYIEQARRDKMRAVEENAAYNKGKTTLSSTSKFPGAGNN